MDMQDSAIQKSINAEYERQMAAIKVIEEPASVNHPAYYQSNGIETIDVIEAWTEDLDGIVAVCAANVIKYISRWNKKNGVEDLKKARWYLNKLIEVLSRE